jgi:exodeoxyribonuclease V alpha subunit
VALETGREVSAVGNLAGVRVGESLRLTGQWTMHPRFGEQFQVQSFIAVSPATLVGIERYLGSGLVTGVGKELASRLVRKFGLATLEVIDSQPAKLREVQGIGPMRAEQIVQAWQTQREIRDVMVFLQSCGVSTALATRIYAHYGRDPRGVIGRDPWRLAADVPGIGFRTADAIAASLGVDPESPRRAEAGVLFVLEQRAEEGHAWAPRQTLAAETGSLLGLGPEKCAAAIDTLAARQAVARETDPEGDFFASPHLAKAEEDAARRLALIASTADSFFRDSAEPGTSSVEAYEKDSGTSLSGLQREAVRRALADKVLVITGGPGTGKTTLITAIVQILSRRGLRVALCAPTGRAAKRMTEASGRESRTIHRLLEWSPKTGTFTRDESTPLACDALILDEASMVDIVLFSRLLAAVPPSSRLILVGDSDQLPSVGPGNVLADLISSDVIPVTRLTEIFRQAGESSIVVNAHRINAGLMPQPSSTDEGDFFIIERQEPEAVVSAVRELVTTRIPRRFGLDPRQDIQVLTPMRKGVLGTAGLNKELQALLNPGGPSLGRGPVELRPGDRVIQMRNNYAQGVFNGDIGTVAEVDEAARTAVVSYDERTVRYESADLDQLSLAYACSIHKSQGSEFPAVVIVLHTQHYVLLRRALLYTAVTRARKLAVIVGSRRALAIAVKNVGTMERCTRLAARLRAHFPYRGPSEAQAR